MLQQTGRTDASGAIVRERAHDGENGFATEWRALAACASEPNAFAEDWFLLPALAHLARGPVKLVEVRALPGELIGLIALELHDRYGRIPVRHVRNWVHYQCFMGTPLVRAGSEALFWQALLAWLDAGRWAQGFLTLREMPAEGPLVQALCDVRTCSPVHRYRRALLSGHDDPEAYLEAQVRGKKRKDMRRLASRLAETGTVAFEVLPPDGDLEGWIAQFLRLEASGWKGKRGAAFANAPETEGFVRAALAGAQSAGRLDFQRLTLDGRAIAMLINFRTPPGSWSFKIAYDEALARFSPGVMIELENLKRVLNDPDLAWMDSCAVEDHPMIDRLWAGRREIVQLTVPLKGLGRRATHAVARAAETASAALRGLRGP